VSRRDELARKLRQITGWPNLTFDLNGQLRLGTESPIAGSKSARDLIARVVHGQEVVVVEDVSGSSEVAFCRVVPGAWKDSNSSAPPAHVVQIDFTDFEHVVGDREALRAFDVGWGFLHELDHIANDSADAVSQAHAGECESHINQMRRECSVPQRADYFFTFLPVPVDSVFVSRLVRMAFEQEPTQARKKKRYWLVWDATLVGGLNDRKEIAWVR